MDYLYSDEQFINKIDNNLYQDFDFLDSCQKGNKKLNI